MTRAMKEQIFLLTGTRPGTKKNVKRAFDLFKSSSEKNLGMALYNMADFYYQGKGGVVRKDMDKAYYLAKEATKDPRIDQRRQADPYFMLGQMYFTVRA